MTGNIHSFESFSTVDGPGIRFVIFMQGCQFRCLYCHNPDTWHKTNNIKTPIEMFNTIVKYKNYIKSGGITISGGEPLQQIDFIIELFELLKKDNINTCIDTNGYYYNHHKINHLMNITDLVLLDIKHINNAKHIELTSKSNYNTLQFAKFLSKINKPMWIRYVLVPGYTDDENDLIQLNNFLQSLNNIKKIEILPFHNMGITKWEELQLTYQLANVNPPSEDDINKVKKILEAGINI